MRITTVKYILISIFFFVMAYTYKVLFVEPCIGSYSNYCSQVFLPDSAKYMAMAESKYIFDKQWNTIGISILYKYIDEYFSYFYFSIIIHLISNYFLLKTLDNKGMLRGRGIYLFLIFCMLPSSAYYVQSPTKEVFLYFIVCLFLYFLDVSSKTKKTIFIFSTLFLRLQYGLAFLSSYFSKFFQMAKINVVLLTKFVFLLVISSLFLLYELPFFETYLQAGTDYLEFEQQGTGFGAILRGLEQNIPLVGLVTVPIKILQNISDPFPSFNLYYHGEYNFYAIKDVLTFLINGYVLIFVYILFILSFFKKMTHSFFYTKNNYQSYIMLSVVYLLVGINTFVQGRYFYPLFPLFLYIYLGCSFFKCVPRDVIILKIAKISSWTLFSFVSLVFFIRFIGQV